MKIVLEAENGDIFEIRTEKETNLIFDTPRSNKKVIITGETKFTLKSIQAP